MIPAEAVEAAAQAVYERLNSELVERGHLPPWVDAGEGIRKSYIGIARAALEAAAPHIIVGYIWELSDAEDDNEGEK